VNLTLSLIRSKERKVKYYNFCSSTGDFVAGLK